MGHPHRLESEYQPEYSDFRFLVQRPTPYKNILNAHLTFPALPPTLLRFSSHSMEYIPIVRFIVILVLLTASSFGQSLQFQFEPLSVEHGLSQSSVWSIYQDSYGFMWFGTADGLNKYDGYTFQVFRHNPNDS